MADKPLIYMDETTFHSWMLRAKSWSKRSQPVLHARVDRRHALTVYGGVGFCLTEPVFRVGASTNKQEYGNFLIDLSEKVKPEFRGGRNKPILLYDGHPAHVSADCLSLAREFFEPLQIPGYSCEFNSIEKVWGLAKAVYNKRVLLKAAVADRKELKANVLAVFDSIPQATMDNLVNANRAYIEGVLRRVAAEKADADMRQADRALSSP